MSKEDKKFSFKTLEHYPADRHCYYSDLPSPQAYEKDDIDYDGMGNQGRVPVLPKNESKLKKLFLNLFKFRKKDV